MGEDRGQGALESFFQLAVGPDKGTDILHLFADRYGWGLGDLKDIDVLVMSELLQKIKDENERDKLREEWLAQLPFMALKLLKNTSFEEYAAQRAHGGIDTRPTEEILAEVEEVRRITGVKHGSV